MGSRQWKPMSNRELAALLRELADSEEERSRLVMPAGAAQIRERVDALRMEADYLEHIKSSDDGDQRNC